jgi:cbb3-type cytochrome oxidase maturation protein
MAARNLVASEVISNPLAVFVAQRSFTDRLMSVIFIALPIALFLAALAVAGFVTTVTEGQYDDLETPPQRMLCDDLEVHSASGPAKPAQRQSPVASSGTN